MNPLLSAPWFVYGKYLKWGAAILLGSCTSVLSWRFSTDPSTLPDPPSHGS